MIPCVSMTDLNPLSPEQKLDRILTLCERMERYDKRRRIMFRAKWALIIFLLIAVPGGGWYMVTHVDDMIQSLADRIAVSVSQRVKSDITSLGDTFQEGADAAAEGGSTLLERMRGYFQ